MCESSFGRRRHRANERAQSLVDQINASLRKGQLLVAHAVTGWPASTNGRQHAAQRNGTVDSARAIAAAGLSCAVGPEQAVEAVQRMMSPRRHVDPEDQPLRPWQRVLVAGWVIDEINRTTSATC